VLNIPSNQALAHFLGQVAHETANFNLDTENLNYSAAGLVSTFKNIFQHQNLQLVMLDNQKKIAKYMLIEWVMVMKKW
jgi:predicted chitinase